MFPIRDYFGEADVKTWAFKSCSRVLASEMCLGSRRCFRIPSNRAITNSMSWQYKEALQERKAADTLDEQHHRRNVEKKIESKIQQ